MNSIDLRIGEAKTVRDVATRLYDLSSFKFDISSEHEWDYQPRGYAPLLKKLEDKYKAPVLITNGAIQGLHAAMYALKKKKLKKMGLRIPYWNRIPDIAKYIGIKPITFEGSILPKENLGINSLFLTMPNNPDGYIPGLDTVRSACQAMKDNDIPVIHDAAYYTGTYLPLGMRPEEFGNVQIYSLSKMYGLSSMRLGYVVCYDPSFYQPMVEYLEWASVGTSIFSQKAFLHILEREEQFPYLKSQFEKESKKELEEARRIFKGTFSPYVLFPKDFDQTCSVFAWVKANVELFKQCHIEVLPGNIFGMPEYVRLNLACGQNIVEEMVNRLNGI